MAPRELTIEYYPETGVENLLEIQACLHTVQWIGSVFILNPTMTIKSIEGPQEPNVDSVRLLNGLFSCWSTTQSRTDNNHSPTRRAKEY